MFNRVIVPVDGSDHGWRAAAVGATLAVQCVAELELLLVVDETFDVAAAEHSIAMGADSVDLRGCRPMITVRPMTSSVAHTVDAHARATVGSMIVVSSSGRGRAEAITGSVAEELLAEMYGPLVVVGPHAAVDRADLRRPLVVPVDGSEFAESVFGLAAAWGIGLEARPWIVEVLDPDGHVPADVIDSSYPASAARRLAFRSHHPVDFEVLHDAHPERAIAAFAASVDASLIVASTHRRAGMARLALGSRAMAIVRHAPCPVVLARPPELRRIGGTATATPAPPVGRRPTSPGDSSARAGFPLDHRMPLVRAAVADLATRLGVAAVLIDVVEARSVMWPDASFGCPEPGVMYVQRPVDGALVVLSHAGRHYEYHGGRPLTLCEQPHPPIGG